jgi:uncharacterized membrane protein YgcG
MRQPVYLLCFFSMAIATLGRIIAALTPFDARNIQWVMAIADPFPPMSNPYLRNIIGLIFLLIVLYFLLKRTLAFVRAGALNVPVAFTQLPFNLAVAGLALITIVTLVALVPHNSTVLAQLSTWLARSTLFLIPAAFLFTEIRSLLQTSNTVAVNAKGRNASNAAPRQRIARADLKTTKLKRANNPEKPVNAPLWSWIIYGLLWPCVTIWIIQFFGKVALFDSARSTQDYVAGLAMAGVPAALVVGLIRLFIDPILIGLAQKRSKVDMAEELLDSVALIGTGVAAEGMATAAANSAGSADAPAADNFTGGGGDFNGGGASGKF